MIQRVHSLLLLGLVVGLAGQVHSDALPAGASPALQARAWGIMGTVLRIELEAAGSEAPRLFAEAWAEFDRVDREMSSYRAQSEVMRLEPGRCTPVGVQVLSVLRFSQQLCEQSEGAFDVTVAPLLSLWRRHGGLPRVPSQAALQGALAQVGCHRFTLDEKASCVRIQIDSSVDLGGVAKGFALDRARERLLEQGVRRATLDLGGQLHHIGAGHAVAILDPLDPRRILASFEAANESVSTSAQSDRYVEIEGQRYGHILDPRSGQPARGILSVTVTHPSGMTADALSTALFVGAERVLADLLPHYPEAGALIVRDPGPGRAVQERDITIAGTLKGRAKLDLLRPPGER